MKYEKKQIKDICRFVGGSQPPKSQFVSYPKAGYVRLIQIRDRLNDDFLTYIPENSTSRFCEQSDILIGRYGPPIFQVFRGFKGAYNVAIMKAEPINGVNKDYLYYFLLQKSVLQYVESMSARTAGQTGVELDSLYEYPVLLPDKEGQERIAGILKSLDDRISTNTSICAELESMAKTLYDYWFVQFDFPDANGKPYRASGGEMVWNEQLKREIPKGWIVQPLSYYLDCNKHTIKRNEWKYDIEYLDTGSLTSNRIGELQRYETIEAAPSRAQRIVHPNDILYSTVRPNQCHYGLIKTPFPNLVASSGFACLASKFGAEYNDLFYAFLSSTRIVERLTSIAASSVSAYPSINPNDIMELLIALPERLETIRTMSDRLCELFSAVAHYQAENRELSQLRDWLLPMLMNGQATVAPAESPTKLQVLQPEKPARDPRFDRWLQTQGVAARGTVDEQTLHDIFDAMDDDDKQ